MIHSHHTVQAPLAPLTPPTPLTFLALLTILTILPYAVYAHSSTPPLTFQQILDTHRLNNPDPTRQNPDLLILGFLTPWNPSGHRVALSQAARHHLDIAVPVTYQLHPTAIAGGHDFPTDLYSSLSQLGTDIYPRLLFEHWTLRDFQQVAKDPQPCVENILNLYQQGSIHGVVLELWQSLMALGAFRTGDKKTYIQMVRQLGHELKEKGVRTILVLPPYAAPESPPGVSAADLALLEPAFDQFIVMTYDFSQPGGQPGPMAPVPWVRKVIQYLTGQCKLGRKVLMGLNFYGVDFVRHGAKGGAEVGDRHVVGEEVVQLLKRFRPDMVWVPDAAEHAFVYGSGEEQHVVFFPTRRSIAERVALAEEVGCGGVAVWELGQGMNHFFDEF
eukprot:GFKZ01002746.1.p1 GENE.GFKZ01002746.1~~GFKZ01002746.1.p1  ORF type:complete len:387 (+),score=47.24 GFKZ01002746.1:183-1343(+)